MALAWTPHTTRLVSLAVLFFSLVAWASIYFALPLLVSFVDDMRQFLEVATLDGTSTTVSTTTNADATPSTKETAAHAALDLLQLMLKDRSNSTTTTTTSIDDKARHTQPQEEYVAFTSFEDTRLHNMNQTLYQAQTLFHHVETVIPWIVTLLLSAFIIQCFTPAPDLDERGFLTAPRRVKQRLIDENLLETTTTGGDAECAICLSSLLDNAPLAKSESCRHRFHRHCVAQWLEKRSTECPSCREPFLNRRATQQLERLHNMGGNRYE